MRSTMYQTASSWCGPVKPKLTTVRVNIIISRARLRVIDFTCILVQAVVSNNEMIRIIVIIMF